MKNQNAIRMTALAAAIAAACTCANAQDITLYEGYVLPDAVVLEPTAQQSLTSDVDLVISGPGEFFLRKSFKAGTLSEFNPRSLAGGELPDGSYTYEIQIMGSDSGTRTREIGMTPALEGPSVAGGFGSFSIKNGKLVDAGQVEKTPEAIASKNLASTSSDSDAGDTRDQVINDDLIVGGSFCVGFDCVNGESFGFDTIRLKENNTRIKFQDTSSSGSFPTNDWQLTANDSANGGANKFSIDDIDNSRTPFTITAGARSNSLFISSTGNIGFGTSTPSVGLHQRSGNTPTLRLEQDGSSGFAAQTWDVASNETNFFIRDATNGSQLPFRIRPSAPSNSIFIQNNGDVGMGTASPSANLHVQYNDADYATGLLIDNTDATTEFASIRLETPSTTIDFNNIGGEWRINFADGDNQEFVLDADGNLTIDGTLTANGSTFPDYVFKDEYRLMPLAEVEAFIEANGHLPNVPSAEEIARDGLNMTAMQKKLFEKVEELTLYTLEQQRTIQQLRDELNSLQSLAEGT